MRYLIILALVATVAQAREFPKELYMPNEAGGFVVLTQEECQYSQAIRRGYNYRAYSEEPGEANHEGCWQSASVDDAPKLRGWRIIPLVNTWWDTGDEVTFPFRLFDEEKKRWIKLPEIEVKPTV